MKFDTENLQILEKALDKLSAGFENLPDASPALDRDRLEAVLLAVAERLQDNYPYFHPLYAGQMLKPPHPVARLAYMLAMWINPNNHALDGGRASSRMEKEAVAEIAGIFGWQRHLGGGDPLRRTLRRSPVRAPGRRWRHRRRQRSPCRARRDPGQVPGHAQRHRPPLAPTHPPSDERTDRIRGASLIATRVRAPAMSEPTAYGVLRSSLSGRRGR